MSNPMEHSDAVRPNATVEGQGSTVEPWLLALLTALVPLIGALFAPESWQTVLHVAGGVLCALGLVMLVRHELRSRQRQPR